MRPTLSFSRRAVVLALVAAGLSAQAASSAPDKLGADSFDEPLSAESGAATPFIGRRSTWRAIVRDSVGFRGDEPRSAPDYLIPGKGKSVATLLTGIPYVAIAEVAYGFTDRFSVGIVGGIVPHNPGYGLRFRYVLAEPSPDFRVHLKMPVIYYPNAKSFGCPGCEPWFLAWPALSAEWRRPGGTRWWVGTGLVATACADTVFRRENAVMETGAGVQEGTWQTLQFGVSKPLTRKLAFQLEVAPVFKGLKLASRQSWVGGPPVILTTGLSYSF